MAVINEKSKVVEFPQGALYSGASEKVIQKAIPVASGDENGSEWLVGEIPGEAIITGVGCANSQIDNGTDFDIGIVNLDGSVIANKGNILADQVDMSTARTALAQLPLAFGVANAGKTVGELVGHVDKVVPAAAEVNKKRAYRIILKGNTAGTVDGTVLVQIRYRDSI